MFLFKVPYPKASLYVFIKIATLFALALEFVLLVFQPFGTSSYDGSSKYLILLGYGFLVILASASYYIITDIFIKDRTKSNWSILHEILFLSANIIFNITMSYAYWLIVFDKSFNLTNFIFFIAIAVLCIIIPLLVYLGYLYERYKKFSFGDAVTNSNVGNISNNSIIINQNYIAIDKLIYFKSDDNYVEFYFYSEDTTKNTLIRATLTQCFDLLPENFKQCHRSYGVNLSFVSAIIGNKNNAFLKFKNCNYTIPVSRTNVDFFREKYGIIA
ncbi:MAG: LytTR family DNA-binding domain-containing protein [Saprospiraceae bacterium]